MKKIIKEWNDRVYVADNTVWEYEKGVKHVHTTKHGIKDFVFEIVFLAGSFFDTQIDVPQGTAHFLEHMLCNPNNRFKTEDAQDKFLYGTQNRPEVFTNASTWEKFMSFYGYGNCKGANRMIEYVAEQMKYPLEKFDKYIENERGVILAELQRYPKEKKDSGLACDKFLYGAKYKGFSQRIIGTKESIKSIKSKDLVKFYNAYFHSKNCVITTQSPKALTKKQEKLIDEIALSIQKTKKENKYEVKDFENEFRYEHFKDDQSQDMFTSFSFFRKNEKKTHAYVDVIPNFLIRNLLSFLLFKRLRTDLGLVYGAETYRNYRTFKYNLEGFKLNYSIDSLLTVFDEIYSVLMEESSKFLASKKGLSWLQSEKSNYIYKRTSNYNGDYVQGIAWDILINEDPYGDYHDEVIDFVRDLTQEDLEKVLKYWQERPPHIWFVSPHKDEKVMDLFKQTKLYNHFSNEKN